LTKKSNRNKEDRKKRKEKKEYLTRKKESKGTAQSVERK
jgi:hypothetical protein